MTGTQSGPFNGLPPTEARIKLPGIDVITLGEGLLSVEGYFDQRTLLEQLGVQVAVQPANVGPLAFGTSVRFRSSNAGVPGALSMTWMDVRDEAEGEEVKQRARAIAAEMARVPGFMAGGNDHCGAALHPHPVGRSRDHPATLSKRPAQGCGATGIRDKLRHGSSYRSLGSRSPQSAVAAVSEVRNHDRPGPSRPVLPLRRTVPSATYLHLTDLSASQGAIAVLLST